MGTGKAREPIAAVSRPSRSRVSYTFNADSMPQEFGQVVRHAKHISTRRSRHQPRESYHDVFDLKVNGFKVKVGQLGAMKYIIDPDTHERLTPGFHEIESLSKTSLVGRTGAVHYDVYPADLQKRETKRGRGVDRFGTYRYPEFLFDDLNVSQQQLAPKVSEVVVDAPEAIAQVEDVAQVEVAPAQEFLWPPKVEVQAPPRVDAFGLNVVHTPVVAALAHQFETCMLKLRSLMLDSRAMRKQARKFDSVSMPHVESRDLNAQVHVSTNSHGDCSLHLQPKMLGAATEGIYLMRSRNGEFVFMTADFETVLTEGDPSFEIFAREATNSLNAYISGLERGEIHVPTQLNEINAEFRNTSVRDLKKQLEEANRVAENNLKRLAVAQTSNVPQAGVAQVQNVSQSQTLGGL